MALKRHILIATFSGVCLLLTGCANTLFFHPTTKTYQTPIDNNLFYEEVLFESQDKTRLSGWFIPAVKKKEEKAKGTIIHFHGNAQNMTAHYSFVNWLPEKGYNLFVFDYRGYGMSKGRACRSGIYKDCVAALFYVRSRPEVDSDKIVVLGQSLGGALAIRVVSDHPEFKVKAVIADSAFASYRQIARDKVGLIPVLKWFKWPLSFLLATNGYSPVDVIENLHPTPLLVIHGTCDLAVPYHHGKRLFESARDPKLFWTVDKGRHIDVLSPKRKQYRQALLKYLDSVL